MAMLFLIRNRRIKGEPIIFGSENIGAIGALMNRVLLPRPLVVFELNLWMGTAAGADELVEVPRTYEIPPSPLPRVSKRKGHLAETRMKTLQRLR